jgi:hypothetical protein
MRNVGVYVVIFGEVTRSCSDGISELKPDLLCDILETLPAMPVAPFWDSIFLVSTAVRGRSFGEESLRSFRYFLVSCQLWVIESIPFPITLAVVCA